MCQQHWLCRTGTHGWCYFAIGELGSGPGASDISDDLWDQLDALQARLRASPTARGIASELGSKLHFALRSAASVNQSLGERRGRELESRYADEPTDQNKPRPFRITIRADQ